MPSLRPTLSILALATLAACADDATVAGPALLPPLATATWYVHTSDGQPVPALLGHRTLPGNVLEQDFLDSATFAVTADGHWEHRGYVTRYRNQVPEGPAHVQDFGTWTATPDGYEFRRWTGQLLYTLSGEVGAELQINLRYSGQAGVTVSVLRPVAPPPQATGRYRAVAMAEEPLPRVYTSDPEIDNGTTMVSQHVFIDSAVVELLSSRRYTQRIYYSVWEGPVHGAPQLKVGSFVHDDTGTWSQEQLSVAMISAQLQNHIILGERSAEPTGLLRLHHGISHGDPPVVLDYGRF